MTEIFLLESNFKRNITIDFNDPAIRNSANISANHQEQDNQILHITVNLDFSVGKGRLREVSAKIIMMGVFKCDGEPIIPLEQFAKANGPAIMFPFLREHLASITLKAGINPILLPSVNFIRLSEENKPKKKISTNK